MPNLTGQSIGRYRIVAPLGEGGMATVYKAFDTRLECEVAIKFIRKDNVPANQWERMIVRFEREAKRMAKFTHPNIVKVNDYGEYQSNPYLVMPYLPGGTLKDLLKARGGKPMPYQEAARILAPVARALEYAHEEDTIHRDVKPANILLTKRGQPMLTDFGVAKILDLEEGQTLTGTGVGVGTPKYMAPEQWKNQVVPQTDVYALGVVFYEMITGRVPFDAETPAGVLERQLTEPLARPKQFVADLPEEVDQLIFKVLARKPEYRLDMGSMAGILEELLHTVLTSVSIPPAGDRNDVTIDYGSESLERGEIAEPHYKINRISVNVSSPSAEPQAGTTRVRKKDGAVMVYVPAGEFLMGSSNNGKDARDDEKPEHKVYLDGYWIDYTPVTNAMYRKAIEAGACTCPFDTKHYDDPKYIDHPVVWVDWNQAQAYCQWVGGRLPSEAQYEKAACGTDGRIYPWGNQNPDKNLLNFGWNVGNTTPVGKYPQGASPYGALDMAGNVWEWVNDWYGEDYYQNSPQRNPRGADSGQYRVLRGGSWCNESGVLRSASRVRSLPSFGINYLGFRCVG